MRKVEYYMMDNEDLVSYYLKKSQDWIFIPQFRTVKIDDDEILDLDSMNLDSNEDTWYVTDCCASSVLEFFILLIPRYPR